MKDREPQPPRNELILAQEIQKARLVFICGNGGSASTSDHFATDLVKKGMRAISLSANASIITMIGNDYGFEHVFSKQLEPFVTKQDLLITISCSGTSPNIKKAQEMALDKGATVYTFETFKGNDRDYGKLENEHLRFAHEVARLI